MLSPLFRALGALGTGVLRIAAGSTLLNGLRSYWPLDEATGVRYDVVGGNHLTDNNTVASVQYGPEGTVATFVKANAEYLQNEGGIGLVRVVEDQTR